MPALEPRPSSAFISEHSQDVKICQNGVMKAADLIEDIVQKENFSIKRWKEHKLHPNIPDQSAVEWIFLVDTLNFSFWTNHPKYQVEYNGEIYTGYWALCAAVNRALQEGIPMTSAKFFSAVSLQDLRHIFRSNTPKEIPLLAERQAILNETGHILLQKFSGSFTSCIERCGHNANKLLKLIVEEFPSYQDEASYKGQRVSFYKRAQILIADIWACFENQGLGYFEDIDSVTMFADYRVPQVLAELGVLQYSPKLMDKLSRDDLLENGSHYEVEIRGCTIWAVELICQELGKRSEAATMINSILIDYCLWDYRREHSERLEAVPFHKTRCIYY